MPKIVSEKKISIPQLKKILEDMRKKRDLNSIEALTLEYATKFSKIDPEKAESLIRELTDEEELPEEIAVQLVNVMPVTIDEIRVILAPLSKTFPTEKVESIKRRLDKYREK